MVVNEGCGCHAEWMDLEPCVQQMWPLDHCGILFAWWVWGWWRMAPWFCVSRYGASWREDGGRRHPQRRLNRHDGRKKKKKTKKDVEWRYVSEVSWMCFPRFVFVRLVFWAFAVLSWESWVLLGFGFCVMVVVVVRRIVSEDVAFPIGDVGGRDLLDREWAP